MPKIVYRSPDGTEHPVDATTGVSLMQAATVAGIDGILAECGGNAMCATCHVYVDAGRVDELPAMSAEEDEMLDCAMSERRPESRLSCQIRATDELDGLVLDLPEAQN